MSTKTRLLAGITILILMIGIILAGDLVQRRQLNTANPEKVAGAIPIYLNGELVSGFKPCDLEQLEAASFIDQEEGKTQEGWLLADVLLLHLDAESLHHEDLVTVRSKTKSFTLTWQQVSDRGNLVLFDLSGRGTLKLVSAKVENFQTRDAWVQDVTQIDIFIGAIND